MNIGTVKAIKYAAILIEKKYPGTCKELIKSIDAVEKHPLFMILRAKAIESKWETIKEWFSTKENLDEKKKQELFDISNTSQWEAHWHEQMSKRL